MYKNSLIRPKHLGSIEIDFYNIKNHKNDWKHLFFFSYDESGIKIVVEGVLKGSLSISIVRMQTPQVIVPCHP